MMARNTSCSLWTASPQQCGSTCACGSSSREGWRATGETRSQCVCAIDVTDPVSVAVDALGREGNNFTWEKINRATDIRAKASVLHAG